MKYAALILLVVLASCGSPGGREAEPRVVRPSEIIDFLVLYAQNCSGCHGIDGQGALAVAIGSPVYLPVPTAPQFAA
jgi:cytochrome c oxidase cbb3-type subunit 3/ubiquinol-cytochrome c reductase cytochrome c subunit